MNAAATQTGTAQPAPKAEKSPTREYVVLGATPEGHYEDLGRFTATTEKKAAQQAVAKAIKEGQKQRPAYAVVPERSFHKLGAPKVKDEPQISFSA